MRRQQLSRVEVEHDFGKAFDDLVLPPTLGSWLYGPRFDLVH